MFIFPKENISFREGNLLCADCKASGHEDKAINNMAHRVTEGTEVTQCHGGADGTKSDGDVAYKFLITILG